MSEEDYRDIQLQRAPGGLESLSDKDRERAANARDPQLERAMDLLKGISLFTQRAPAPERRVAKGDKVAAAK
jgi:hypothetical protein